jgi:PAS domain S-box-containing protein
MNASRERHTHRGNLALAALLASLLGLLVLSYRSFSELTAATRSSLHTYTVLKQTATLEESIAALEAGFRGYALTRDPRHLQGWRGARLEWMSQAAELGELLRDDPAQLRRLEAADRRWRELVALQIAAGVVDTVAAPLPADAVRRAGEPVASGRRSDVALAARTDLSGIEAAESELLRLRVARTEALEARSRRLLGALGSITLLLALLNARIAYRGRSVLRAANDTLQREVEARQQAQDRAERAAREHSRVLNAAAEGIMGVDASGRITFLNPAAERILGLDAGKAVGEPLDRLLSLPADVQGMLAPGEEPAQGNAPRSGEATFRRATGETFPAEFTVAPLSEVSAEGAVVTFRDVTERREVERMKDEFVSVVSHELRTPLTSIRGSLGLLAAGTLGDVPERGRRMLEIAVQNTDRLVRLINDILDIERIESGKVPMRVQRVDAAILLDEALEVVQPMADRAGIRLRAPVRGGTVEGDRDRLVQVLTNLLSNAVKFSEPGGAVDVHTAREGRDVVFRVHDRGRGIPSEHLESVFERFRQIDSSDARQKGGTGLGLAIARSIVLQHGGRIWAESAPGEGSTFTFCIPAAASDEPLPESEAEAGPPILVCDDDADVRETVAAVLRAWGYRPLLAADGADAVEIARREAPAAILMDIVMPGMNGGEAVAALRDDPATRGIPVVVVSVMERGTAKADAPDVSEWVEKPFEESRLLSALETALGRHWKPARVLVVEDDPDLARVLVGMFQRHGVQTMHAATGRQAVDSARAARPDMVVLDLMLPDGDGYWVVDALRRDDDLRGAPLVVYSALDVAESDRRRLRLGETEFLTKGRVAPEALERHVVSILNRLARPAQPRAEGDGHG